MPGNITPAQMFTHEVNAKKGWPSPYAVDFAAPLSSVNTVQFNRGAGAYLDENGDFRIGSTPGAVTIFLRQGITDLDANSDVGNISGGVWAGFVATGAYELYSTEFVLDNYVPNDYLQVVGNGANIGLLAMAEPYKDTVCGIVSKAPYLNKNGANVIQFWTYHLPPLGTSSSTNANETSGQQASSEDNEADRKSVV